MAYQTNKLTAVPYFYDKQLRRYIQQFIRIFAGFQVGMHVDQAGEIVYQTVPVRYGDVSRMAAHIVRENSENMTQTTPFISCHVTGLETAPDRRTSPQYEETVPVFEKKYDDSSDQDMILSFMSSKSVKIFLGSYQLYAPCSQKVFF